MEELSFTSGLTEVPFKTEDQIKAQSKNPFAFVSRLWGMYNKSFLASLALQYFNNGFNSIVLLAYMYRFLHYYKL